MKTLKKLTTLLVLVLSFNLLTPQIFSTQGNVMEVIAATVKLNKKTATLVKGKTLSLKVIGTKKKVTWKSSDKKIATVSSNGKVTAKKKGTVTITATIGNKKLSCKITVKDKKSSKETGERTNPYSAYSKHTITLYEYGKYVGKFKIQLLDYKSGKKAYNYVMKNKYNKKPKNSQEYIYLKFKISYISGKKQVDASDIINYHSNLFNSKANYQLNNIDWGYSFEDIDDMTDVSLYPGGSAVCSKAIIVKKGNSPITYRIQTGYDNKNYEPIFTWFTTKK